MHISGFSKSRIEISERISRHLKYIYFHSDYAKYSKIPDKLWPNLNTIQVALCGLTNLDFLIGCNKLVEIIASSNPISSLPTNFSSL